MSNSSSASGLNERGRTNRCVAFRRAPADVPAVPPVAAGKRGRRESTSARRGDGQVNCAAISRCSLGASSGFSLARHQARSSRRCLQGIVSLSSPSAGQRAKRSGAGLSEPAPPAATAGGPARGWKTTPRINKPADRVPRNIRVDRRDGAGCCGISSPRLCRPPR